MVGEEEDEKARCRWMERTRKSTRHAYPDLTWGFWIWTGLGLLLD